MSNPSDSSSSQQVNEIKKKIQFEDLENGVSFTVELRPGQNRLIVRVREEFLFSM